MIAPLVRRCSGIEAAVTTVVVVLVATLVFARIATVTVLARHAHFRGANSVAACGLLLVAMITESPKRALLVANWSLGPLLMMDQIMVL